MKNQMTAFYWFAGAIFQSQLYPLINPVQATGMKCGREGGSRAFKFGRHVNVIIELVTG